MGETFILNEVRNWIIVMIGIIGAAITIRTYIISTKQRRIDNTFKTIEYLRRHIGENQIRTFIELFQANNELLGIKFNEFKLKDGRTDTIENMFSEGGCGNGDIHNIIELFNLISPTLKNLENGIVWYEYGQIMIKIYDWTKYLEDKIELESKFEKNNYFYSKFNSYMKANENKIIMSPTKYYTYFE